LPKVTFIFRAGQPHDVDGTAGSSVMLAARMNDIVGIEAECGGALSCATCHVYVAPEFIARLPAVSDQESEMLECVAAERRDNSRLSCQIVLTEELDGLVLEIPAIQS
jgi:2Fe-2S ferredoxin